MRSARLSSGAIRGRRFWTSAGHCSTPGRRSLPATSRSSLMAASASVRRNRRERRAQVPNRVLQPVVEHSEDLFGLGGRDAAICGTARATDLHPPDGGHRVVDLGLPSARIVHRAERFQSPARGCGRRRGSAACGGRRHDPSAGGNRGWPAAPHADENGSPGETISVDGPRFTTGSATCADRLGENPSGRNRRRGATGGVARANARQQLSGAGNSANTSSRSPSARLVWRTAGPACATAACVICPESRAASTRW